MKHIKIDASSEGKRCMEKNVVYQYSMKAIIDELE